MEIETNRLRIAPYTKENILDLYAYRSNPAVSKYYSIEPKSVAELEEYINEINEDFINENSYTLFIILQKKEGIIIGDITVKSWGKDGIISAIGFAINPAFQRQGYGKEAVKAFCDYLLEKENRKRIQADVDSRNTVSIKILEYVGMKNEKSFTKVEEVNGEEYTEYMYGINKGN